MCCALWSVLTSRIVINIRAVGQSGMDELETPIEMHGRPGARGHRLHPSILPLISCPKDCLFSHETPSPGVLAGRPRRERPPPYDEEYHVQAI